MRPDQCPGWEPEETDQGPTKEELVKLALASVINSHSLENESGTADYILAEYLYGCLQAWNKATQERHQWFHRVNVPEPTPEPIQPQPYRPVNDMTGGV